MSRIEAHRTWRGAWTAGLLLAALMLAGPVSAEDTESMADSDAEAAGSASEQARAADPTVPLTPDGGEPYPTLHVPDDGWRYVSDYYFALTRGLEREPIEDWVQYTAMAGTVPVDLIAVPGAAIAGLFGP